MLSVFRSRLGVTLGARRFLTRGTVRASSPCTSVYSRWFSDTQFLEGRCECKKVGWKGKGTSAINFTCHCSICRSSSGLDALTAAGFKENQIDWINESGIDKRTPPNSKNARLYCKGCGTYIGEDATGPFGVYALPLHICDNVDKSYRPNQHIFYEDRVKDFNDKLPKWKTVPQGEIANVGHDTSGKAEAFPNPSPEEPASYDERTGQYHRDVYPISPTRAPESKVYHFTETDPYPNHVTYVAPEKVAERVAKKYEPSPGAFVAPKKTKRGAIVIGGGHNGLVSAAYLAKNGMDVCVLERRHVLGGAAVTEEIVPGFKFSRASYLAGLLRPQVIKDLELERHGLKYLPRNPSSFTPTPMDSYWQGKHLLLGDDHQKTWDSIAQFSRKDADAYFQYEEFLDDARALIQPILDNPPPNPLQGKWREKGRTMSSLIDLLKVGIEKKDSVVPFYELFTGPASHILDRYFESEILKTTLATDAIIGAQVSPSQLGSAYVLLHHVMGEAAGKKGVWAYVEGGMGKISECIADSAREHGAEIITNATVKRILYSDQQVTGVEMHDGTVLEADVILSNSSPYHTLLELMPGLSRDSGNQTESSPLPTDFQHHIRYTDFSCGAFKINVALKELPNFLCAPSDPSGRPGPQHMGTIHFESTMQELEHAYREASMGVPASRPVIEMTLPSSVDRTISPEGQHVCHIFVQYAPYRVDPKVGNWADEDFKNAFADRVFSIIDEFAPNFSSSVIGRDVLSPLDLERIFGLNQGNIFHGSMALHQLGYARPAFGYSAHRTPMKGLYICGSGAHPGGGVMGAPGRNCANVVLSDLNIA